MYLNCHSVFSFKYGTLRISRLLELAKINQQKALVLTDINNTSACLNFIREAEILGVKPLVGIDFRSGAKQKFVGIAKDNQGYEQLNRYLSNFLHQAALDGQDRLPIPNRAPQIKGVWMIYPFSQYKHEFIRLEEWEYIGISIPELKRLPFSPWRGHQDKFVLLQTVSFENKRDFNIHRLLRAIGNNCLLSKLSPREVGSEHHQMYSAKQIEEALQDFPQIRENTERILSEAKMQFNYKGRKKSGAINHNKQTFTDSKVEDQKLLRKLSEEGIEYRYPEGNQAEIRERLEKELKLIHEQGFESYFLINWDMLRFAREKNFFYVGRGSGANSIVAYLLRITDVDPVKLDLYFERFINPYRENPPDFDIDFSWKDREEVTDYLFEKYGENHQIALLATYQTFSYKSLMRELGKVFGLPKQEIDVLSAQKGKPATTPDDYVRLIYRYAGFMDGMPSHLSVHAGGVIISEKPVYAYSATSLPPKGYPIVQFDMVHAEDAGLYKFDILSQRGLGKIKDSVDLVIQRGKEPDIDIHQTERFFEDEAIKELLRRGDAMGCFYVESPAMRMLLQKLKADNYLSLVAASSIIRPGVAKSGMMREYILRSQAKDEKWRKSTPQIMQELMAETYGVMVYQEDVIKVAHFFAGLSLGEADMLRRGMSGKFRSRKEFAEVKQKFFDNCRAKGYSEAITKEVWRQTESFAGYAFSKGHSASYAVESYQSLYLKAHYPMEFILGVVNNGGGFYSTEMYLHQARLLGARVEAPCVNHSELLAVLEGENTLYIGFYWVKDLEERMVKQLLKERQSSGEFKSLEDFLNRCEVSKEQLTLLIRIGAFRFTQSSKAELLWEMHGLMGGQKKTKVKQELFAVGGREYAIPQLDQLPYEDAFDQMELLGFPLISPFSLLKDKDLPDLKAADLMKYLGKQVKIVGYLVTVKNTRTTQGKLMQFGTFVDEAGAWIDTVHFPPVVSKFPFRGKGCYLISGRVVEEFGYASIEAGSLHKLDYVLRTE